MQLTTAFFEYHKLRINSSTSADVERCLKGIKRLKSAGLDDLPPYLLKDSVPFISLPLAPIINLSFSTGFFPSQWKNSRIVPVYKSESTLSLGNYRPISILPFLSKIIEKLVHQQLMKFLDENRLLSDFQFGFRPNISTELADTLFLDNVRKNVNQGYMVGATFNDLSKAFDTVSHSRLVAKLHSYGLNGTELEWFTSYLFNRNALVSYNGCISSPQKIGDGVPQASILGPLLFILYFNDVVYTTEDVSIINYADDTVIYTASKEIKEINAKLLKKNLG